MRPYTGTKEGIGKRRRPGTEAFAARLQAETGGRLWNNGTFAMRPMRGSSQISVHATGRAIDVSRRKTAKYPGSDRAFLARFIEMLVMFEEEIQLEMVIDYGYTAGLGGGRVWKCDRQAWKDAKKGTIQGGGNPASDWIHIELSPAAADSPEIVNKALDGILRNLLTGTLPEATTVTTQTERPKYPGRPLKYLSKGKAVEAIQRALQIVVDGNFGSQTDRAVREFQEANGLVVDGIVGVNTWGKLFGSWQ